MGFSAKEIDVLSPTARAGKTIKAVGARVFPDVKTKKYATEDTESTDKGVRECDAGLTTAAGRHAAVLPVNICVRGFGGFRGSYRWR
ncbi:MAG: hypothetical protein WCC36_15420, partial [Gammaproteobacteria bacterium]